MGFYEHFSLIPLSSSNDGNARIGIIANSCEIHVVHIPCRLRLIKHCKLIHTWSFLELHLSNALLNISLINEKHSSSWCVRKITQILLRPYFQCSSPRWEPQISILCEAGQQYLPQYLSEDGRWSSELSVKVPGVSCLRDKMDLLDYCKKVSSISMIDWMVHVHEESAAIRW